ncbi:MAG: rhomboid family intramembrane serine protease [Anaerolineales bacterium]|nr:rhomboid family intramembrane serine protease [Anaerolineales bacterium]
MLPLTDSEPNRYELHSSMMVTLILVNTLIMIGEMYLEFTDLSKLYQVFRVFGFTPSRVLEQSGAGALMSITSVFLHGGLWHLFGNMIFLWTFGRRVEDACGPWRFLFFYLTCGVMANLATAVVEHGSPIPHIGASGAISGIIGAYFLLFPGGRIRTFVLLFYIPIFPRIRAFWFILFWVLTQLPPALFVLYSNADYSVGYWAHLGGFFSAPLVLLFLRPQAFQRYINGVSI